MAVVVGLNAITFNDNVPDGNGVLWYVTEMTGWDSAPIRSQMIEAPTRHGMITTEGLYSARNVTINGVVKAPNEAAFYEAMYYLMGQTNFLKRTTFTFKVTEDITRRMEVVRNGENRVEYINGGSFTFNIQVRADDPFKYTDVLNSEIFVASISEVIVNGGTAPTYPTITLNGTGTPIITCGALTWQANTSIPSGTVLDMKNQTIKNGNTSYFDAWDPTSEWLFLEPGNNTVESNVPVTVNWRDAWV